MDAIHLGGFAASHQQLSERFASLGLMAAFESAWVEPEQLAIYISICKECPDSAEAFPHGKWASIQFLEEKLTHLIRIGFGTRATEAEKGAGDEM